MIYSFREIRNGKLHTICSASDVIEASRAVTIYPRAFNLVDVREGFFPETDPTKFSVTDEDVSVFKAYSEKRKALADAECAAWLKDWKK